jgi:hypothetical protein
VVSPGLSPGVNHLVQSSPSTVRFSHILRTRLGRVTFVILAGAAIGAVALTSSSSRSTPSRATAALAAAACPTPHAAARADAALRAAEARYRLEERGTTIHTDLRQIAHDKSLIRALSAGDVKAALAAANRQLVRHVVQIRVLNGERVLFDANPTSFDVAGSALELHAANGRSLGRLQITVQDLIGFIKLVRKLDHANVVVHGAAGQMKTSLPAAARIPLPRSGCTQVGSRRYVVRSFQAVSFVGEPLTIWVLTAA